MKDITSDIMESLKDEEELKKRTTFTGSTDKEFTMSPSTYMKLMDQVTYYEVENLDEIDRDWDKLSEQTALPFSVLAFLAKQASKQMKENPKLFDEMKSRNSEAKSHISDFFGDAELKQPKKENSGGMFGKFIKGIAKLNGQEFEMPTTPTTTFYLSGVTLNKIRTIENDSFVGSEYEITDNRGNTIPAVHFRENAVTNMFDSHNAKVSETKEKLDMMRLDPRPATVVCIPMYLTKPRLQIIRVQSGGKRVSPPVPTIPGM